MPVDDQLDDLCEAKRLHDEATVALIAESRRFLDAHDDYMADKMQSNPSEICHKHVSNLHKILKNIKD